MPSPMHLAVLIAGVLDPKRALVCPASGQWPDLLGQATTPFKLSPFDESALEIALKLRDRNPGTQLSVIVTDGANELGFLRAVAGYRPDRVLGLPTPAVNRGHATWLAQQRDLLNSALDNLPVDLWLMGREHGDMDDGVVPPYLAHAWGFPFVGLALSVQRLDDGRVQCVRETQDHQEKITLPCPALISVSNDKGNKLRHPLMKNVMLAKQQTFKMIASGPATPRASVVALEPVQSITRGDTACRLLTGTLNEQAQAFANYLLDTTRVIGASPALLTSQEMATSQAVASPFKSGTALSQDAPRSVQGLSTSSSSNSQDGIHTLRHQGSTLYLFSADYPNEERAARFAHDIRATPLGRCEKVELDAEGFLLVKSCFGARLRLTRQTGQGDYVVVVRNLTAILAVYRDIYSEDSMNALHSAARGIGSGNNNSSDGLQAIVRNNFDTSSANKDLNDTRFETEILPRTEQHARVEGARLVISGGRGIGSAQGFDLLYALAQHGGGAVSASLPAVDAGWAPVARQVGQSGKYIRPDLYVAIGISGTPQHMAGLDPLTRIAAINADPEAPIFKQAQVGIVGDWALVVPEILKVLQEQ